MSKSVSPSPVTTHVAGTMPLCRLARQCIDPASGIDSDALECRTVRQAWTRAHVLLPAAGQNAMPQTAALKAAQERANAMPVVPWVARLADKNRRAAQLTQERQNGAWPALRVPKSVERERAVTGPLDPMSTVAAPRGGHASVPVPDAAAAPTPARSFLVAGWEHACRVQATRKAPSPWRGRLTRAACLLGAGMCVAGGVMSTVPMLGVGVAVLGGVILGIAVLLRPRPRPTWRIPELPCDAQHLGGRHSILRAAGAAACELKALQKYDLTGRPDSSLLRRIIDELAASKVLHIEQERAALCLVRTDSTAAAERARMAAYLHDWSRVENSLRKSPREDNSPLSDAALLRVVWTFLNSRDALDECLSKLPEQIACSWDERATGKARVHLANWQRALRTGSLTAQEQLERFCAHAWAFLQEEYPRRLVAQRDSLLEHWVSREQVRSEP